MMKTTNTLMTEIKDLNEGRDILFINWNKLSVLPELLYRFTAIQSKFQQDFFYRNRQAGSKIYMEKQKLYNSKSNFNKEEQSWISRFTITYQYSILT